MTGTAIHSHARVYNGENPLGKRSTWKHFPRCKENTPGFFGGSVNVCLLFMIVDVIVVLSVVVNKISTFVVMLSAISAATGTAYSTI